MRTKGLSQVYPRLVSQEPLSTRHSKEHRGFLLDTGGFQVEFYLRKYSIVAKVFFRLKKFILFLYFVCVLYYVSVHPGDHRLILRCVFLCCSYLIGDRVPGLPSWLAWLGSSLLHPCPAPITGVSGTCRHTQPSS